jgi:hypothetical protein
VGPARRGRCRHALYLQDESEATEILNSRTLPLFGPRSFCDRGSLLSSLVKRSEIGTPSAFSANDIVFFAGTRFPPTTTVSVANKYCSSSGTPVDMYICEEGSSSKKLLTEKGETQ